MGAIADIDDLVNKITGGNNGNPESIWFHKDAYVTTGAPSTPGYPRWFSLWDFVGQPCHGTLPTSGPNYPTRATSGALGQSNPTGGRQKWCLGCSTVTTATGSFLVYDRLAEYGGLNGTTSGTQSCGMTLSSRYTGSESVGNQIWVEIVTDLGGTACNIYATYTNQNGTTSCTGPTVAIGASGQQAIRQMLPLALASGDTGVRGVDSITLDNGTASGTFAVLIIRPLFLLNANYIGYPSVRDFVSGIPGPVESKTDACLAFAEFLSATTIPYLMGGMHFIEA